MCINSMCRICELFAFELVFADGGTCRGGKSGPIPKDFSGRQTVFSGILGYNLGSAYIMI